MFRGKRSSRFSCSVNGIYKMTPQKLEEYYQKAHYLRDHGYTKLSIREIVRRLIKQDKKKD